MESSDSYFLNDEALFIDWPSIFNPNPSATVFTTTSQYPQILPIADADASQYLPPVAPEEFAAALDSLSRTITPSSNEVTEANTPNSSGLVPQDRKRSLSSEDTPIKYAKGRSGSRFKTEAERQETRNTREKGACLSCQMGNSKRRCPDGPDPEGPCARCLERVTKVGYTLCCRPRIRDIEVFRRGPSLEFAWSQRWTLQQMKPDSKSMFKPITELPTWRRGKYKTVEISQGHGTDKLCLRVCEYTPIAGDRQHYTWYDGDIEKTYKTPAFAIVDLGYARNAIKKFLEKNVDIYLNVLLKNASPITQQTFQTALKNQDLTLLEPVLRLWVASRFIETPWKIIGRETLGMAADTHVKSPYHGHVPVTPIMDFQIDNLVILSQLHPLLKEILNTLKTKTLANKKEDWFEIQLTQFILLNNIELTMAHDVEFARRYDLKDQWSNRPLIEMITYGANTLLRYFHSANKGHYPFSGPWAEVERSHHWTEDQKKYISAIRHLISQQREIVKEPERELFWTSQLHRADWDPVTISV